MLFLIIALLMAIIVILIHSYTFYSITFNKNNNLPLSQDTLIKLSLGGAMVPYAKGVPNNGATTVVSLTDAELAELLQILYAEIGNSQSIHITLLESLGLNTETVISVLQSIGYTIIF